MSGHGSSSDDRTIYYHGSGETVGRGSTSTLDPALLSGPPVTVNLANAPVEAAAKAVMGDVLGLSYSVAPGLGGTVTVQTAQPVSRAELIRLFQDALATNGAAIIRAGQIYRIDTIEQARNAASGIEVGSARSARDGIGAGVRVVPLRYVSATEMQRVLEPMVGGAVIAGADDSRNVLTLSGGPQEIANVLEMIAVFDVDVMKGMSFAVVPVRAAPADAIADELRNVFGSGGSKGMVRFLPNNRLRSILVASPQRDYLARAEMWIRRLDGRAQGQEQQLFTYRVQHRNAKEMVALINDMFSPAGSSASMERSVAPRYDEATLQTASADGGAQGITANALGNQSVQTSVSMDPRSQERVRVTADDSNNSLLILASPADYKRVQAILANLDVSPRQILLEATIAEVSLNDDLKFGVRWYLQDKRSGFMFTDLASKAFDSVFPGFSYALQTSNVQVTLDALNKVTHVNIVSAPSLMVLDNRTAMLQIGDQVPIVTQSASSVQSDGAPIVNSVSYRDTGVILQITPRINDSGRVLLDIEQEVSSVISTTSSGIDSPTIKQRKVNTSVMVDDGQVLALGGIIQNQKTRGASKVPILGDIPVLGNAFKSKTDNIGKTELIILITPRVVRDAREAQEATEEYRQRLNLQFGRPRATNQPPRLEQTVHRVFE